MNCYCYRMQQRLERLGRRGGGQRCDVTARRDHGGYPRGGGGVATGGARQVQQQRRAHTPPLRLHIR